jgi:hypothetical protein
VARNRVDPVVAFEAAMKWPAEYAQLQNRLSLRDMRAIRRAERTAKQKRALAIDAAPRQRERLQAAADDTEKLGRRLANERWTEKSAALKVKENIYNKIEYALLPIADACPPLIKHLGLLKASDRPALIVSDHGVKYSPSSEIRWQTGPPDGRG